MKSRPVYDAAKPGDRCERCGRDLYGHALRMLELDSSTGLYSDGGVAPERSQGWFAFGLKCAKRVLAHDKREAARRAGEGEAG